MLINKTPIDCGLNDRLAKIFVSDKEFPNLSFSSNLSYFEKRFLTLLKNQTTQTVIKLLADISGLNLHNYETVYIRLSLPNQNIKVELKQAD